MEHVNPSLENPTRDAAGESPVEIIEFSELGLMMRSIATGKQWSIEVNMTPDGEDLAITELPAD